MGYQVIERDVVVNIQYAFLPEEGKGYPCNVMVYFEPNQDGDGDGLLRDNHPYTKKVYLPEGAILWKLVNDGTNDGIRYYVVEVHPQLQFFQEWVDKNIPKYWEDVESVQFLFNGGVSLIPMKEWPSENGNWELF